MVQEIRQSFANRLHRRRSRPGDKWHLYAVFIPIQGVQHYLWRAVDQDGIALDILVRIAATAKRIFRRCYVQRAIVTDMLRSYGVAKRQLLPDVEHRQSRYLNNGAKDSHRPARRRERQMQRFKSREQARTYLSAHAFIHGHFDPRRHVLTADAYRTVRSIGFEILASGDLRPTRSVTRAGWLSGAGARRPEVTVTMPVQRHYTSRRLPRVSANRSGRIYRLYEVNRRVDAADELFRELARRATGNLLNGE